MEPTYDYVRDDLPKEQKREYWDIAMGLQAVDGLKPSKYLVNLAEEHIDGEKTYKEVRNEVDRHYNESTANEDDREADKVSAAIYEILADEAFTFDVLTYRNYHKRLFSGLDEKIFHPGEFRVVNITKKEPILNGDTVQYQDFGLIEESLKYDFEEERAQNYAEKDKKEIIGRLAEFTSRIWQVHPFYEGNTRTTAVFVEKYLRSLGCKVDNEMFEKYSLYFRNALVRANYNNVPLGIVADKKYLEMFFGNLLFGEKNVLNNDDLKI